MWHGKRVTGKGRTPLYWQRTRTDQVAPEQEKANWQVYCQKRQIPIPVLPSCCGMGGGGGGSEKLKNIVH